MFLFFILPVHACARVVGHVLVVATATWGVCGVCHRLGEYGVRCLVNVVRYLF